MLYNKDIMTNQLFKHCKECTNIFYKKTTRSLKSWNEVALFCTTQCKNTWCSKNQKAEKSPAWKSIVTYSAVHKWINFNYGKADRCDNKISFFLGFKCSEKFTKYHWARLHNRPLERNRNSFVMLCVSCHNKYDHDQMSHKRAADSARGWHHSEEAKKRIGMAAILRKSGFRKGNIPWNKEL